MRSFVKHNLNEAKSGKFGKLTKLTDNNDHNGAIREGLRIVKANRLIKVMDAISIIHKAEGSMPQELIKYRDTIYQRMMKEAKRKLSPEEYTEFHGAF